MKALLILQAFSHFTYVTAHSDSPSFPSLHLRHSSFSNHSLASPTSQLILQPFRCFTYVTSHSPTLPLLHLRHSSFSNPSFASPTSQDFHLASSPWRACYHLFHSGGLRNGNFRTLCILKMKWRINNYVTWKTNHSLCLK